MKTHQLFRNKSAHGFTLIEIMVVIAIILVLASMTIGGLSYYKRKAAESRTEVFIASVSRALDEYRADEGNYPTDGADGSNTSSAVLYDELYGDRDGDGVPDDDATVYLDALNPSSQGSALNVEAASGGTYYVVDGWGGRLHYLSPGEQNPSTEFDLWSYGNDGSSGTEKEKKDDIDNW